MVEPKSHRISGGGHPWDEPRRYQKGNASIRSPAQEDLLDSPAEARLFLRRIVGRFFKRRICACSDCSCRHPLDSAHGHRLCGLYGAPPRKAVPPLWGSDPPRDPPETSEGTIEMGSMAVVLPLRLGGRETPRARLGSAGSARRPRFRISLGGSGLRGCPDILLALGRPGRRGRTSTRPSARVQVAGRRRAD